jgi:hypothetical protein
MPSGDPHRIRSAAQSLQAIAVELRQHGAVMSSYAVAVRSAQHAVRALNEATLDEGTATEPGYRAIIAALDRRARRYARDLSTGPVPGSAGSNRR